MTTSKEEPLFPPIDDNQREYARAALRASGLPHETNDDRSVTISVDVLHHLLTEGSALFGRLNEVRAYLKMTHPAIAVADFAREAADQHLQRFPVSDEMKKVFESVQKERQKEHAAVLFAEVGQALTPVDPSDSN